MDLGSIFLILALLIIVAMFVAKPLIDQRAASVTQEEQAYSALMAQRDRVLDALQELDFDYTLGKIPEVDYPPRRAALLQQGAEILKKLDAFNDHMPSTDTALEAAISARSTGGEKPHAEELALSGAQRPGLPDDEIEALIATRRRSRKEKSAGFCPQCGRAAQKSDKFCSKCGATLI